MKFSIAAVCAAFTLGLAGSAFADGMITATLESPVEGHAKFIAAHSVFTCEGTTCTAVAATDEGGNVDSCRDVAKKVGRIASYKEFKPLDEKALARCNMFAAAPKPATTASR